MAASARIRGDIAQAEEYDQQVLGIRDKLAPGSIEVAESLNNLGELALYRRDVAKAEEYFLKALVIQDQVAPKSIHVAESLHNLGVASETRGDLAKAETYIRRALAIQEKLLGRLDIALSLDSLGEVVWKRGNLTEAQEYLRQALAIQEEVAPGSMDVAESLHNLGGVTKDLGNLSKAEAYFREALAIREKLAAGSTKEAETLHGLASTLLLLGQADQAIAMFERSVSALESQTRRLGGTEAVRSDFRSQYNKYYRDYISALLATEQPERAFHVLERSRARSLLSLMAERDLVFAADLPPDIQRQRKYNAAAYDRIQGEIAKLNPKEHAAEIEQSLARMRELATEREEIAERVKRISPRWAALQYPQPLDLQGTRRALDAGTVLLSYSVGVDQTDLFVVQTNGSPALSVYTVPIGEMALRNQIKEFRSLIEEVPHIYLDRIRLAANRVALNQRARALYDLLVKPAETQIAASQRLLIAPDGPLHTLPFSALARKEREYLVEWKPLHTIVSATLYAELKKTRIERRNPPLQLAAFGNPRYPRLDQNSSSSRSANVEVAFSVERGLDLTPLPFTKDEVEDIAKLYPNRKQINLGADATEERAKSDSPRARYVHFAVHGFLDELFPLNSGLALTIPQKADGHDNGLLQAWEILEQVRLEADLVVLSACQTGLGKELNGEGLIGLTRAFQYAGARTILASLWNVDDLKTAGLMKGVYAQLQTGKSKDQSLRNAQLEMLRFRGSSHPYYWAAFTLIGDWQ
jgi:CHAT domain-containing protein/Tfp pilus assembly protein PilF